MGANRDLSIIAVLAFTVLSGDLSAQSTKKTVRRHKVAEADSSALLTQAETAIEKKDYASKRNQMQWERRKRRYPD